MTLSAVLFVLLALVLVFLLAWASRPPKPLSGSGEDIFELLSRQRHCMRLHFILRALHPEDTRFLGETGNPGLMRTLRVQRREIALQYIDQLEEEFETLLEISRAIAVMAPEVTAVEELSRWRLSLLFSVHTAATTSITQRALDAAGLAEIENPRRPNL